MLFSLSESPAQVALLALFAWGSADGASRAPFDFEAALAHRLETASVLGVEQLVSFMGAPWVLRSWKTCRRGS